MSRFRIDCGLNHLFAGLRANGFRIGIVEICRSCGSGRQLKERLHTKVRLSLYASLGHYLPDQKDGNTCTVDIKEGITIGDLLDRLNIPVEIPKLVFLNGVHSNRDAGLNDGDEIGVFPPVAGG